MTGASVNTPVGGLVMVKEAKEFYNHPHELGLKFETFLAKTYCLIRLVI